MYDLKIVNGTIIDGRGSPSYSADIGIAKGRIVALGKLESDASAIIDAAGQVVSPGFIDLHTHSDASFLIDPSADSKVRQGCTLELAGNCGMSFCGPVQGAAVEQSEQRWQMYGPDIALSRPDNILHWNSFGDYMDALASSGSTLNIASQVGHGTIRAGVIGFDDRAPTVSELDSMATLVSESLDAGALGFSTGLFYAPGSYARTDEIVALAGEAAKKNKLYSTHMRDEGNYSISLLGSVEESIAIGRLSGVRVQISHLKCLGPETWGQANELLTRIEHARNESIDLAGDQYPYTAGSTNITGAIFPRWTQTGGREGTLKKLSDESLYPSILHGIAADIERRGGADKIVIANYPSDRSIEGKNLAEIAKKHGISPSEVAVSIYLESETSVILHSMEEPDVEVIAEGKWVSVASDGSSIKTSGALSSGKPHPRSYGTFPRFLGRYVREKGVVSLEEGIRKMTSLPASRLNLSQRGAILPGFWGDITIFNPATVSDTATFDNPHSYPTGISHVLVNGVPVVNNGSLTNKRPGKVIRRFND